MLTGITIIGPGSAIPHHFHNCEETVLVLEGTGWAEIGRDIHEVGPLDTTWIPAEVPHRFRNGSAEAILKIFWVYASVDATRTLVSTGETRPVSAEHAKPS
jgi:quercetin dioxygenase-like cupin family protein